MASTGILNRSSNLYQRLLRAYPAPYRHRFSDEMSQVFRDLSREIYAEKGINGLLNLWLHTLADLLKTALEERLKETTNMTKEKFIRLGGWALILSGFTMTVIFLNGINSDPFDDPQILVAFRSGFWLSHPFLLALGFIALRSVYVKHLGALGNWALLSGITLDLLVSATILFALLTGNNPYSQLFTWHFIGNMAVILLFGIDALKQNYLHGWKLLPLITGLIPLVNSIVQSNIGAWPRSLWPLYRLLRFTPLVFSIGTLLLGYVLIRELNRAQEPA